MFTFLVYKTPKFSFVYKEQTKSKYMLSQKKKKSTNFREVNHMEVSTLVIEQFS